MASFNPTQIFDDGTTEEKGENARLSAFGKPNPPMSIELHQALSLCANEALLKLADVNTKQI